MESNKINWMFALGVMVPGDYKITGFLPAEVKYTDNKDGSKESVSFPISQLFATKEEFLFEVNRVVSEIYDSLNESV